MTYENRRVIGGIREIRKIREIRGIDGIREGGLNSSRLPALVGWGVEDGNRGGRVLWSL
jgi:hypothetical protein